MTEVRRGNPSYLGVLTEEMLVGQENKRYVNGFDLLRDNTLYIDPRPVHSFTRTEDPNLATDSINFIPFTGRCVYFLKIISDANSPKEEILIGTNVDGTFKITNLSSFNF